MKFYREILFVFQDALLNRFVFTHFRGTVSCINEQTLGKYGTNFELNFSTGHLSFNFNSMKFRNFIVFSDPVPSHLALQDSCSLYQDTIPAPALTNYLTFL